MSRRLGQVFLRNKHIRRNIADYVLGLGGDNLVEIGPGSGAITEYIYEKCRGNFTMVEIDERLMGHLYESFPEANIVHGDILETDFGYLDSGKRNILFGNIPYYITSPIILRFLGEGVFSESVFMVQEEYYEVISAPCRTGCYSCMSALIQTFVDVRKVMDVGRKHFYPVPKVDSTVVHLIKSRNGDLDLERYSKFLRKCFGMPRKTLWNNLRKHFDREVVERLYGEMGIEMNTRPEERGYEFFVGLFNALERDG